MTDWLVRLEAGHTVGPVSTELLKKGIRAGKVPLLAQIRAVGESEWRPLESIQELAEAWREAHPESRPPLCTLPGIGSK